MTNDIYQIQGEVEFLPKPDAKYYVTGVLNRNYSAIWIADAETGMPVNAKKSKKMRIPVLAFLRSEAGPDRDPRWRLPEKYTKGRFRSRLSSCPASTVGLGNVLIARPPTCAYGSTQPILNLRTSLGRQRGRRTRRGSAAPSAGFRASPARRRAQGRRRPAARAQARDPDAPALPGRCRSRP